MSLKGRDSVSCEKRTSRSQSRMKRIQCLYVGVTAECAVTWLGAPAMMDSAPHCLPDPSGGSALTHCGGRRGLEANGAPEPWLSSLTGGAIVGDRDWRQRIKEGKAFDRETIVSWRRVYEGSRIVTDHGMGRHRRVAGRPDIRFVIGEAQDSAGADAVLEVKDRDWDRMKPANARRAVRRDRRQILRYIEALIESQRATGTSAEIVASLVYRRAPTDGVVRQWAEDYLGEMGVAVLWESGDAAESEWFARLVRSAEASLQPWADRAQVAFGVWVGTDADAVPALVIRPRAGPGRTTSADADGPPASPRSEGEYGVPSGWAGMAAPRVTLGSRATDAETLALTVMPVRDPGPVSGSEDISAVADAAGEELACVLVEIGLLVPIGVLGGDHE